MSIAYGPKKIISGATAGADHVSTNSGDAFCFGRACDVALYNVISIQLIWAGLTGTLDGKVTVEVSNDGVNWDTKKIGVANAEIQVSGAAGNDTISITDSTERYYRANWAHTGVTGGTINCFIVAKGQ